MIVSESGWRLSRQFHSFESYLIESDKSGWYNMDILKVCMIIFIFRGIVSVMRTTAMTCEKCGASLEKIGIHDYICPFCDTKYFITDIGKTDAEIAEEDYREMNEIYGINLKFEIPKGCEEDNLQRSEVLLSLMKKISIIVNETNRSDDLIPRILESLQGKKEAATSTSMEKDYKKVLSSLQEILEPEENLIMYKTAAVLGFNKLKTGMFLTDRRVGYKDSKSIYSVKYESLDSFMIEIGFSEVTWWYPNGNEKIFVTAMALNEHEFATLLAFIILRTNERTSENHKIILEMKR